MENVGLLLPGKSIGTVIGKAGSGLKQAREESGGCKVDVPQGENGGPTRRVNLIGDVAQIASAFSIIVRKVFQDKASGVPCIMVRADGAGNVVGKGGENLKRVREATGVKITVEREPVIDALTGMQERMVALHGDVGRMGQALSLALGYFSTGVGGIALPAMTSGGHSCAFSGVVQPATAEAQLFAHVKPPGDDPEEVQLHIHIPEKLVDAVVGEDEAQIKHTAAASGCSTVAMTSHYQGPQRIFICGTYYQAFSAQNIVFEQMRAAAPEVGIPEEVTELSVVFFIRKEAAGAILGKQGQSLIEIRDQSLAKIKLEKGESVGHRACMISGELQDVFMAERLIFDIVREVPFIYETGKRGTTTPDDSYEGGPPAPKRLRSGDIPLKTPPVTPPWELLFGKETVQQCMGNEKQKPELKPSTSTASPSSELSVAPTLPPQPQQLAATAEKQWQQVQQLASASHSPSNGGWYYKGGTEHTKILVPSTSAGTIIGKSGSGLKALREDYGVKINMPQASECQSPLSLEDRVVILAGPVSARQVAIEAILGMAFAKEQDNVVLKLLVPSGSAGAIVGKRGATLKQIRELTSMSLQLNREEVNEERLFQAAGTQAQVNALVRILLSILDGEGVPTGMKPVSAPKRNSTSLQPAVKHVAAETFSRDANQLPLGMPSPGYGFACAYGTASFYTLPLYYGYMMTPPVMNPTHMYPC